MQPEPERYDDPDFTDDLGRLEVLATWMDNRFVIPGTRIRFGLDALIGLVPYVGDIAGFAISGFLFTVLMRRGASPALLLRLMGNFLIDALVGAIPLLGDLFDVGFKANRRNVELLRKYYNSEPDPPALRTSVVVLLILFLLLLAGFIWLTAWLLATLWSTVLSWF